MKTYNTFFGFYALSNTSIWLNSKERQDKLKSTNREKQVKKEQRELEENKKINKH